MGDADEEDDDGEEDDEDAGGGPSLEGSVGAKVAELLSGGSKNARSTTKRYRTFTDRKWMTVIATRFLIHMFVLIFN